MNNVTRFSARSNRAMRCFRLASATMLLLVPFAIGGCSLDGLLQSDDLPDDVSDPALTQTPAGARAAYNMTLALFREAYGGVGAFIETTGLLTDEIHERVGNTHNPSDAFLLDRRVLPDGIEDSRPYGMLHKVRGQAGQAIELIRRYLPDEPTLAGHLYALEGYAELFLAELYCSGIPLSTIDFDGDYTFRAGSSTQEVLAHAAELFDSALVWGMDSTSVVYLAQLGRARALLGMGDYVAAAAAVAAIPDAYSYEVEYTTLTASDGSTVASANFANKHRANGTRWYYTIPDVEGINGMDWRTSGDPRSAVVTDTTPSQGYRPAKYSADGSSPIVLTSGVEARLVEAEAALQAGNDAWLDILNALRTDGTYDTTTTSPPDTLWHAGSGGYDGLAPLEDPDPGSPSGATPSRVDLLFRERAFWLFLTGSRQGDLRRLVRQYGRSQSDIYPIGIYASTAVSYGSDVTMPIPTSEYNNPLFKGCASRGA